MGTKFVKETFQTQNEAKEFSSSIPIKREGIELLSHTNINTEFNKMYLNSRGKLHAITENPSEEMLKNITHYMKQNSKSLTKCFNKANAYYYDILDIVTERHICQDGDNSTPTMDSKHLDSFFTSSKNYDYGKQ